MLLLQRSQARHSQEVSALVHLSYQSTIQSTCENLGMLPLQRSQGSSVAAKSSKLLPSALHNK
jgi:hypothetical protein